MRPSGFGKLRLRVRMLPLALLALAAGSPCLLGQRVAIPPAVGQAAGASQPNGSAAAPAAPTPQQTAPPATASRATDLPPARPGPHGMRDPFRPPEPPRRAGAASPAEDSGPRPPGIGGLMAAQIKLQGIVEEETSHSNIAMVTAGSKLAYFLRENDRLYDAVVSRITADAVYLHPAAPRSGSAPKTAEIVLRLDMGQGDSR